MKNKKILIIIPAYNEEDCILKTYNSIVKHPIKIPILGTMESIAKIEKEDLYTCYNTFYHPNNMILVITGNVKPESILEIIKNNQNKKEFAQIQTKLKVKKYNEPDEVATEEEDIFMNIAIPNVAITYKFNILTIMIYNYFIAAKWLLYSFHFILPLEP